jgi:tetratricopeptide (TPR) repeat protein
MSQRPSRPRVDLDAGASATAAAADDGYGFGAAAAILGVSESRLRYWSQIGFVGPSFLKGGKQVYSFQDLTAVKAAKELVERGFSTADIRKAIERVRARLPGIDRPLEHLRVAFDGKELVVVEDGAAFALSGQRVFDFGLGELRARATGWGRTTPIAPLPPVGESGEHPLPDSAYGWWREGLHAERDGRDDQAMHAYRRALKLDPGLGAALTNIGGLAHRRGDFAEARASFEAALALDPDQPEARYNLAHLLIEAGEVELGAAELRRVLELAPDFADAHFNLATALEGLGGRRQAREHLLRFLELAPGEDDDWTHEARTRLSQLGGA